jgi:hypothetical protein
VKLALGAGLVVAVAGALILRTLFPRSIARVVPPRTITVYDTVVRLDTAWVARRIRETRVDTVRLERLTVTAPETVRVCPRLAGLTFLEVPAQVGESTVALGFQTIAQDTGAVVRRWRAQWWTVGPLRALAVDSGPPRISFYPVARARPPCGVGCQLGHYATGAALGAGLAGLACAAVR